ncbi:M12 family metallo-peptidase [Algoriphagus sp. CAU 1675]|uniref:M12 family metallo-peptidase n=1 Tax=Algoriphagus sp. CAU 1675 TaxID=3032597 RepID=UPI0023DC7B31|nr:M12 family metallo-peptidase [Algoriphagus sp. CAU 1675]MDF2156996.1 M12 family metallo-peptidase [Algoriphagus sp. CAU 1675]
MFQKVDNLFLISKSRAEIESQFFNADEVLQMEYNSLKFNELGETILIDLPFETYQIEVLLEQVPSSFYSYDLVTSDGKSTSTNVGFKHYRGVVKGDLRSIVAFSFSENEVVGMIANDKGNFNLVPTNIGNYLLFNDQNLKKIEGQNDICEGSDDVGMINYPSNMLSAESKLSINSSLKCVELYFETEYDIFQNKGSVSAVEFYVSSLFNQVAILYENENIGVEISQIFVWTSADPYTATDRPSLLTSFQNTRTSFNGHLGQLLTFRIGGGRAADGFNGLCNSNVANRLSIAGINSSFSTFPTYSNSVMVITHEFGHLLGSRHTHACVWNGNNTAIDGCGAIEGSCSDPGNPSGGGTIMSYCHVISGVGVNFNNGFGLQPGNVIRNSVANANCVCNCVDPSISGSNFLCSTGNFTLTSPPPGTSISWSVSPVGLFSGSTSGSGSIATLTPYHPNTRGGATLTFNVTSACKTTQVTKNIWVQAPLSPGPIIGNSSPGPGSISPYMVASLPSGATSMSWSLPYCVGCSQPWSFYSGQTSTQMTANVGDAAGYVQAMGVNPCGTGGASLLYVTPSGPCDPCARTFPNPISNEMTLEWFDTDGILIENEVPEYKITLYNAGGGIIMTKTSKSPNLNFDLAQLKNGFYFLHIENKDGLIRKQIRVER